MEWLLVLPQSQGQQHVVEKGEDKPSTPLSSIKAL